MENNPIVNKLVFINKYIPNQPKKKEEGNREYKISLNYTNYKKQIFTNIVNKKATQLLYRLNEGGGETIYIIGINDNGTTIGILLDDLIKSCTFLDKLCKINNAIFNRILIYRGSYGFIATIRIYKTDIKFHLLLQL